jgi:hypothetical protein
MILDIDQIFFFVSYTVIRFVSLGAKFGSCTVMSVNETLVEAKMCTAHSPLNVGILSSTSAPFSIYIHDGASARFSTR